MVQLIIGEKGKGKTKILLDKANTEIKSMNGSVVYLDKNKQHMYELNNKIRLVDVTGYPLESSDAFIGFLCGMISQDRDLEQVYLDSLLTLAHTDEKNVASVLDKINHISETYHVNYTISVSVMKDDLPEKYHSMIIHE